MGRDGNVASSQESVPVAVRLVVTGRPGDTDALDQLPPSLRILPSNGRFYVDVWVSRGGPALAPAPGLAAVYTDIDFDPKQVVVNSVESSSLFSTFAGGDLDDDAGKVRSVGGCAPLGDGSVGVATTWVRIATLGMQAQKTDKIRLGTSAADAPFGISLFGRFDEIQPGAIDFGGETVRVPSKLSGTERLQRSTPSTE
jgi:hypothetical protein